MQSRLPDVNTAFIKHRNNTIQALDSKHYDKVFGSLYAWNALLPPMLEEDEKTPKYRITISDQDYDEATKTVTKAICYHCEEMTDYQKINIFELYQPLTVQVLSDKTHFKVWICSHCHKDCKLENTTIAETSKKEPNYLGVVPKPPRRKDGLHDRGKFDRKVQQWAWTFISELEQKTAQFRDDYKENKGDFESWENDSNSDGHLEQDMT